MEIPRCSSKEEKRRWQGDEKDNEEKEEGVTSQAKKKPKVPALASVIVEALKLDSLQRLCSSLEPLLRRIVSEEVERALAKLGNAKLSVRNSPPRIEGQEGRKLQLCFRSKLPPHLFTGGKVEGEQGAAIHVVLLDASTGLVVPSGPESAAKLDVVVLEGDFNNEDDDWTKGLFESFEVKEREGKRPLLTGDLQVCLKEGVGTLGDLTFTDNSSWIRSRKFRLGLKVADGYCDGIRVREARTEAFAVKDHRGELYKKHYPPALHDEVWRLDRIGKDGALHKKLVKAEILTVEDFLRLLVTDPQRLRLILGSGMSNRMWENTVEHAKTCILGGKLYVYYTDESRSMGVVFNHIYELRGLITNGQFLSAESLSHSQKVSVDLLVKRAYENWIHVVEYDGKALLRSINSKEVQVTPTISSNYKSTVDDYTIPPSTKHYLVSNSGMHSHTESAHFLTHCNQSIESPIRLALATVQEASTVNVGFQSASSSTGAGHLSADSSCLRDGQGLNEFFSEEEIRLRSSEMLEHEDMQCLLRTFGVGRVGTFGHSDQSFYSHSAAYEPQSECGHLQERGRGSGKAVVGWLKLKAALRWGIFIRKQAAEKRAQLVELD